MDAETLRRLRLHATGLTGPRWDDPTAVVGWFGAVQSQDYAPAIWSLGHRIAGAGEDELLRAFDAGVLLRTHVLRPTWHFVTPADIRWLLALTAPRVHALNAYSYRQQGLDEGTRGRAAEVLAGALEGGRQRTRTELRDALATAGLPVEGLALGLLLLSAELDAVICSGARRGKQHTYALLDERVPPVPELDPDEALATLTRRYVSSHGPATAGDLRWWSSLTAPDVRRGLALAADDLTSAEVDGLTYWWTPALEAAPALPSPTVHLLQAYDEYLVAFRDSQQVSDPGGRARATAQERPVYNAAVLVDGRVVGRWKRTLTRAAVAVDVALFDPLDGAETDALHATADAYAAFLGRHARVRARVL